jgi:hypothetical protein
MPVMTVSRDEIMPGMRDYLSRAGFHSLLSQIPDEVMSPARKIYGDALLLAEPLAVSVDCDASEMDVVPLPDILKGRRSYSVMAFSIGALIDEAIESYFSDGKPLEGLLLDSWGSESVESLAVNVDRKMRAERGEGTIRFAPGYGKFDVRYNYDWLNFIKSAHDEPVNLSVDRKTGIIIPRKSIICTIGWGIDEDR